MSTLNVNTVQSSTSNPPIFKNSGGDVAGTLARAWVSFNGRNTVTINESFNVTSITDNGNGDYTVNLTTPTANTNSAVFASGARDIKTNNNYCRPNQVEQISTAIRVTTWDSGSTKEDHTIITVVLFDN